MPSLRVHHLTASVAGRTLFDDVTLHLDPGWTGLVGPNGAGKSTFLRLLAGLATPERGFMERMPTDATVVLVPQRCDLDEAVRHFDESNDRSAGRWRARLELSGLERWSSLSFGERKRWQIAAALWREPDVLLLDEPTNHLDAHATELLFAAFERAPSVNLLVSHDRALLDRLTTRTLRLQHGQLTAHEGAFSEASAAWRALEATARSEHQALSRAAARVETSLDRERRVLSAVTRRRSAGARMKSKHDSDGRGMQGNFLAERAQGAAARASRRLQVQRERIETQQAQLQPLFDDLGPLALPQDRCPNPVVARLAAGAHTTPDGRTLFSLSSPIALPRDVRLGIAGANGSGKSTLLELIRRGAMIPAERVLFMPQEFAAEHALEELDRVRALPRQERGRKLQWVHALGVDPDGLLASRAPSAGEARLLELSLQLALQPWLLLLDEPTNHLSFELIERLQHALLQLQCAVVLVSHDAALLDAVTDSTWTLPGTLAAPPRPANTT